MDTNTRTRKWLLSLAAFVTLTSGPQLHAGEYSCSGSLKTDLENVMRARAKRPGEFVRLDRDALKFEGHIDRGTYEKFLAAIDDDVKILIINSSGGDSYDAERLGLAVIYY
jgi:hypothetical protein